MLQFPNGEPYTSYLIRYFISTGGYCYYMLTIELARLIIDTGSILEMSSQEVAQAEICNVYGHIDALKVRQDSGTFLSNHYEM